MTKKIIGGLFFAAAALALIGSIANGTLGSDQGSAAETYGMFIGTLLPVVVYIFSALFLLRFDKVCQMNYIDGLKARKKQCTKIVGFIIVYTILTVFAAMGAAVSESSDGLSGFILNYIVAAAPYLIPLFVFACMLSMYATPYWACEKNFNYDDTMLNAYLSANEVFYTYSKDNSILANNRLIFFPKLFCAIPLDQIASVKLSNLIVEQDVYFHLRNGKRIIIVTKQYDNIMTAINANKPRGWV